MKTLLKNVQVYMDNQWIENGYLLIENDVIDGAGSMETCPEPDEQYITIELSNEYKLIPGFIDLHIHGAAGADTMDGTQEALGTMAAALPMEGTTSFLATTMTTAQSDIERALQNAATYINQHGVTGKAEVLGVHLEGPFISPKRIGAQHPDYVMMPSIDLFRKWQELAGGHIKLVTMAPEQPNGLELVRYLKEQGVVASIGHSDATYEEVVKSMEAGVNHATHLYNQMRPIHHREPGVVGAVLLHDEIKCEIIADGIHSRPEMVRFAYNNKGQEGLILITDAMRAKCLGEGTYDLGGQDVTVKDGQATLADGTLAGSILTLKDAAKNVQQYTKCGLEAVIQMASVNPAKQLNVYDRKGSIETGKDADLVILDQNDEIYMTFCRGQIAYTTREG
ncbi:N-acetylglucosamine-6-phosphate deacetylase [Priestia abyssalis]|uniref:N-acetylglucosamine-6-phosphate deacetylase n=1 Tax=Priestia abyssalis TaxID=1221450 RepID=UPI000995BB4A|nr:N-acetylglucosamine-6-phosphate deacetylase [Priestia abyssalis]